MSSESFVEIEGNPPPLGAEIKWLDGAEGRRLRMCVAPGVGGKEARGTVIVCPGRTEFIEKYFEVGRELQALGFAVLILDWPGQGLSSRLLPDSMKGHIDTFETFMNALRKALDELSDTLPRPHVSLAHSMGGAIALAAITQKLVEVDAAAFSAPMWGLKSRFMVKSSCRARPMPSISARLANIFRSAFALWNKSLKTAPPCCTPASCAPSTNHRSGKSEASYRGLGSR